MYGAQCYRKNPQHFKEFKHPHVDKYGKPKAPQNEKKKKKETSPSPNSSPKISPKVAIIPDKPLKGELTKDLELYKTILRLYTTKNTISADDKRLLRKHRTEHNISNEDHFLILKLLGWTEEEWEDGEKKDEDIDLEEERKILEDDDGFQIIHITRQDAKKSKERINVFSKVCTKFYETMSKAQANFTVNKIGIVVNTKAKRKYLAKKLAIQQELKHDNNELEEAWGFHGTSAESIQKISASNFLRPDELKQLNAQAQKGKKKPKHNMKEKPVELLDDGYFGKGIYFTLFSDYALWYSEERNSDQVLLSKLLPGKPYKCLKRMGGQGLMKGHHSHTSPKGNEVVIFDPDQILPRYIIYFESKEAEEREQES